MSELSPLSSDVLPAGIRARFVADINGLRIHILEAGYAAPGRPARPAAARLPRAGLFLAQGHADAGRGRVPRRRARSARLWPHHRLERELRRRSPAVPTAERRARRARAGRRTRATARSRRWSGTISAPRSPRGARWYGPTCSARVALMSAPFGGPPELPFDTERHPPAVPAGPTIHEALAALPRPRKHYQWWYSTRPANAQMWHCKQGVHDFLRAYFHHKSADWKENRPHRLAAWTAEELAKMPTYYIMDLADDMPAAVAKEMPSAAEIAACRWLPGRASWRSMPASISAPGFRAGSIGTGRAAAARSSPSCSCSPGGRSTCRRSSSRAQSDWGVYQRPGAVERMQDTACTRMVGCHLLEGAGHWVQQEQAAPGQRAARGLPEGDGRRPVAPSGWGIGPR